MQNKDSLQHLLKLKAPNTSPASPKCNQESLTKLVSQARSTLFKENKEQEIALCSLIEHLLNLQSQENWQRWPNLRSKSEIQVATLSHRLGTDPLQTSIPVILNLTSRLVVYQSSTYVSFEESEDVVMVKSSTSEKGGGNVIKASYFTGRMKIEKQRLCRKW